MPPTHSSRFGGAMAVGRLVEMPASTTVFRQGDACHNYLWLLTGSVKVFSRSHAGKELLLYRVCAGQSCVLTTSCLLGHKRYPAEAVTETAITARMIDRATFESLLGSDEAFRHDVFSSLSHRLAAMIERVEELTMDSLESRLITYLLTHEQDGLIKATHQVIANEIGSAREVVSRHLKMLSDRNLISLTRGAVLLKDRASLQQQTQLTPD